MSERGQVEPVPSDTEFVDRVGRQIAGFPRFRWVFLVIEGGLFIVVCSLLWGLARFIEDSQMPGMWAGFAVGIGLGLLMGLTTEMFISSLFTVLWGVPRGLLLLVRYHDLLKSAANRRDGDDAETNESIDRGRPGAE